MDVTSSTAAFDLARQVWDAHRPPNGDQAGRVVYDYVPGWLAEQMPKLYSQDGERDPVAWLKLFSCESRWTFYATEYSAVAPDSEADILFGYLLSPLGDDCDEWCYLSLEMVRELRSPTLNLPVERDLWWRPRPISEILAQTVQPEGPAPPTPPSCRPTLFALVPGRPIYQHHVSSNTLLQATRYADGGWGVHQRVNGEWMRLGSDRTIPYSEMVECLQVVVGGPVEFDQSAPEHVEQDLPYTVKLTDNPEITFSAFGVAPARNGGIETYRIEPENELPTALPKGWTVDDLRFLLDKLEHGPILVSGAGEHLGIPTIHNFDPRAKGEHIGMGVIKARTPEYTIVFDAGSEMARTPSGHGYTRVDVRSGVFPYDVEGVRGKLEAWLQVAEVTVEKLAQAEPKPATKPNPYLRQSAAQLNRELKRIDKELKSLNARQDVAYDIAINDRGESLRRLQSEIDAVLEKRQQVVDALLAQQKPDVEQAQPASAAPAATKPAAGMRQATEADVAEYEGQWDVYFETGSTATFRKAVKRVNSVGILRVALERADRGLSAATLEKRRQIIRRRIRQLEKAA